MSLKERLNGLWGRSDSTEVMTRCSRASHSVHRLVEKWEMRWHGRLILLQAAEEAAQGESSGMREMEELQRDSIGSHKDGEGRPADDERSHEWVETDTIAPAYLRDIGEEEERKRRQGPGQIMRSVTAQAQGAALRLLVSKTRGPVVSQELRGKVRAK